MPFSDSSALSGSCSPEETASYFNLTFLHGLGGFENIQLEFAVQFIKFRIQDVVADALGNRERPEGGTAAVGHGQINFFRVIADAFFKNLCGFVDLQCDHVIEIEFLGGFGQVDVGAAGGPVIETLTGLFTQVAGFHQIHQNLGRFVIRGKDLGHVFQTVYVDVDADVIHKLKRRHGHKGLEGGVEFFRRRMTGFQNLGQESAGGDIDAVVNEARRVFLDDDRNLVDLLGDVVTDLDRFVAGFVAFDHFHKLHQNSRIEKVVADDFFGAAGDFGNFGNAHVRGI